MRRTFAALAALTLLATPAAATSFDLLSGTGSASKQDLTGLFGKAVADSLEAAESVEFSTQRTRTWRTSCRREGTTVVRVFGGRVRTTTRTVISTVETNPSGKPQGWSFDGYGSTVTTGTFCPAGFVRVSTPQQTAVGVLRLRATFDEETKTLQSFQ